MRRVCYNKLWKLLIDKKMNKVSLGKAAGISLNSVTKLSKDESVTVEILVKICNALDCDIGEIMEVKPMDVTNHDV